MYVTLRSSLQITNLMHNSFILQQYVRKNLYYDARSEKHQYLKTLQHVSIIIEIIFREFVGSLLKSLT